MSCLAAVLSRDESNELIRRMLEAMATRGIRTYGIATQEEIETPLKLGEYPSTNDAIMAIGCGLEDDGVGNAPQPLGKLDIAASIAGRVFPNPPASVAQYFLNWMTEVKDPESFVQHNIGAYAFAVLKDKCLTVGRDPSGAAPLYTAKIGDVTAFATERKALWSIGATRTEPFRPGSIITISEKEVKTAEVSIPIVKFPKGNELLQLLQVLRRATERRLSDVDKVALAFSGGVDSSIVARLVAEHSVKVELVHVVFDHMSRELEQARRASRALGLDLTEKHVSQRECEEAIPEVLWAIENDDVQSLEIALPTHFVSRAAREMKCRVVLTGQGADELFAGYAKYQRTYSSRGESAAVAEISCDILGMHEKNIARDEKVCARSGVEIRSPFWDVQVISLANSIPIRLKLTDPQDPLRKRILRDLGSELGLPEMVSKSPKKAVQYGSGSHRLLEEIALRSGKSLAHYCNSRFEEVKKKELSSLNLR
jgi:asparagine synthase (glutamine-hydrolysing)